MNFQKFKTSWGKAKSIPSMVLAKGLGVQIYVEHKSSRRRSNFNEENIISSYIKELQIQSNYAVDIAAGDGLTMSNTYSLFRRGWTGLVAEFDDDKFSKLAFQYKKFRNVDLVKCMVVPGNIQVLLKAHGAPKKPGFLSLDIDGYDYFVLDALLENYRPSLMCIEINEKIPPPINFTVKFDPNYRWAEDHFYGQSISQLYLLAQKYSYALVHLEYNNAFLVPAEINNLPSLTPAEAYKMGYLDRPDRKKFFAYNFDMEQIHQMTDDQALKFVDTFFAKYRGQFTSSLSGDAAV